MDESEMGMAISQSKNVHFEEGSDPPEIACRLSTGALTTSSTELLAAAEPAQEGPKGFSAMRHRPSLEEAARSTIWANTDADIFPDGEDTDEEALAYPPEPAALTGRVSYKNEDDSYVALNETSAKI
jgi:hypothetical protein